MVFVERPWFLKNNSREDPSPRKIHKIALKTSNLRIFPTTTPNSVILVPKFSESLSLSPFAFIVHMFVAFIYFLCFLTLGTIVLEPFEEDFQEQAFHES
jgi:hypothetical protein